MNEDINERLDNIASEMERQFDGMGAELAAAAKPAQADWNNTNRFSPGCILNRPSLSTVATTGSYNDLTNRPALKTVATTGSYYDLTNRPTIPAAQVQADWDESDSTAMSYILNKPEISGGGSDDADYLCFTAGQANSTVRLDKSDASLADVDLEYSIDKQSWTTYTWSGTTGETITLANAGDKVWFRGDNQTFSTSSSLYYSFVVTALDTNKPGLRVDGNIMSLLDKSCKSVTIPCDYCFYYLFKNQWRIMSAPYLPAVDFGGHKNCYAYMFYACSGLNEVHDFPVFKSFYDCNYLFFSMFSDCKSLTKVPKFDLGAANIPNGMCQSMFYQCSNLVDASGFTGGKGGNGSSTQTMGESAFYSMFSNCTSLTVPPSIWYTISSKSSFELMFSGCTSLVNAPELFVQSKGQYCFKSMFSGCTSLIQAPKLVGGTNNFCYESMFSGCTSLVNPPELNASTAYTGCYRSMFSGCTSLVQAPKLPATTLTPYCYQSMFSGCTSLVNAPELNASTLADQCYKTMFNGCTSLKYLKLNNCTDTNILYGVTTSGVLVAPDSLDVSGFMPATWTKVDAANTPDDRTTSEVEASSGDTFAVCPGSGETGVITVASALTLTAMQSASTDIAYAEVVIDLAVGATVTAGSNLTLVDTPTAGKRNICVVRWQGGAARLYVVDVMDLPA